MVAALLRSVHFEHLLELWRRRLVPSPAGFHVSQSLSDRSYDLAPEHGVSGRLEYPYQTSEVVTSGVYARSLNRLQSAFAHEVIASHSGRYFGKVFEHPIANGRVWLSYLNADLSVGLVTTTTFQMLPCADVCPKDVSVFGVLELQAVGQIGLSRHPLRLLTIALDNLG